MMHPNMFFKVDLSNYAKLDVLKDDVKPDDIKHDVKPNKMKDGVKSVLVKIGVGPHFKNEQLFIAREHMFQWVC